MNKIYRLRSNMEFKKVYSGGKSYWNRNLVLYVKKNNIGNTRVGYSITKKIGNSVVRNKIRRRMKEIYRLNFENIKNNYDLIFIPKKNTVDISYKELESAMLHILKLGNLLMDKRDSDG
ncbi:ribonuclease P protein component [Tissierella pigra]|uniref:Ribonuclease P protein component n=1 Tax=Tissierella pigra TaxID=2607614 RepID=A0A6N7XKQ9_9FIRM|nr:ribonuclease P protein component [Tissierella pigra]MBU5428373.1 ribonuclease P protein component [Tissierella pigra]MSU02629.1 ribonuclease P protein component [Tissierella pigra]